MWKEYQTYWKHNYAKSVGYRSGLRAWKYLCSVFIANMLIIPQWFIPLLVFSKLVIVLDFVPSVEVAEFSIALTYVFAFIQLIYICCTKRGEKLITTKATKIESKLFPQVPTASEADHVSIKHPPRLLFTSYTPPVPTAPPRTNRT